ncbi:MAG: hypothetical protein ACKOKE_07195 [Actinomycetota bacterium]
MDFIVKVAKPASGGSIVEGYYLPPAALDNPKDPFFHDPHQLTPLGFKRSGLQRTEKRRSKSSGRGIEKGGGKSSGKRGRKGSGKTATEAGTSEEDDDEDIGEEEEFADLQGDEEKERLFRLNLNQRGEAIANKPVN